MKKEINIYFCARSIGRVRAEPNMTTVLRTPYFLKRW